jgi:hypothetical protein
MMRSRSWSTMAASPTRHRRMVCGHVGAERPAVGRGKREEEALFLRGGDATEPNELHHDQIGRRVAFARRHHAQLAVVGDEVLTEAGVRQCGAYMRDGVDGHVPMLDDVALGSRGKGPVASGLKGHETALSRCCAS